MTHQPALSTPAPLDYGLDDLLDLADVTPPSPTHYPGGNELLNLVDSWFTAIPEAENVKTPTVRKINLVHVFERSIMPSKEPPSSNKRPRPTIAKDSDKVRAPLNPVPTTHPPINVWGILSARVLVLCVQVIDNAETRLAKTQRTALSSGRSSAIDWRYDKLDQLTGAYCDGKWFGKDELFSCSTLAR